MKHAKIVAGVAVVLLTAGLFWNYTGTIKEKNQIERERIASQERLREAELEQAAALKEAERGAEAAKEAERQANLDSCLFNASMNYSADWDNNCKGKAVEQEVSYQNCLKLNYAWATTAYCRDTWPVLPKADCKLPTATADRLNAQHQQNKDACYLRYK